MSILKNRYNPDNTLKGLECHWEIIDKVLYVEIDQTNCLTDWWGHLRGAFKTKRYKGFSFHVIWFYQAFRFYRFIRNKDFEYVKMNGYSHGGATAKIVDFLLDDNIPRLTRTYGSPRPARNKRMLTLDYRNPGDYVPMLPFWYKDNKPTKTKKKWQPIWKAHQYDDWRFK